MKKILVTGGCGFIGSHLTDELIKLGNHVTVLDNLSTGLLDNLNPKAKFIEGDIRDQSLVLKTMKEIDACFHLAAIVSVDLANKEPLLTHDVNLTGTLNLYTVASLQPKKPPIIYASSSAVYGEVSSLPVTEDARTQPISLYGATKLASELYGRVSTLVHRVPTIGLRFFNVYGPRQNPNSVYSGVISIFADKISKNLPICIYGDGEQTRDFIYVADVVQFCIRALDRIQLAPQVFNVCTNNPTSINSLASRIENILKISVKRNHKEKRPGDIVHSYGSPEKANQILAYSAKHGIDDGLKLLLANA
ncbi:MAG: NAD-dependent epimerase/dehydratase family protein [Gammaproteobacteria bacterium]